MRQPVGSLTTYRMSKDGVGQCSSSCAGVTPGLSLQQEVALQELIDQAQELNMGYGDGCPVCHGDCSSANPPVIGCPMNHSK